MDQITTGTQVTKDKRSGWRAEDKIEIGHAKDSLGREGKRVLYIATSKRGRGGISTIAHCAVVRDSTMTWAIGYDFYVPLAALDAKCTEKSVRTQHAAVMANVGDVVAKARAYYEQKDAAAALHAKRDAELKAQDDYDARVRQLEAEGLCTSDAQGVADAEQMKAGVTP